MGVGPTRIHVAALTYSTDATVEFRFDSLRGPGITAENYTKLLGNITVHRGYTFIDKGLQKAQSDIFTTESGMRDDAHKVMHMPSTLSSAEVSWGGRGGQGPGREKMKRVGPRAWFSFSQAPAPPHPHHPPPRLSSTHPNHLWHRGNTYLASLPLVGLHRRGLECKLRFPGSQTISPQPISKDRG